MQTNGNQEEGIDIRIEKAPQTIHKKLERYIGLQHAKRGYRLRKGEAALELLEKATKNIKLIAQ